MHNKHQNIQIVFIACLLMFYSNSFQNILGQDSGNQTSQKLSSSDHQESNTEASKNQANKHLTTKHRFGDYPSYWIAGKLFLNGKNPYSESNVKQLLSEQEIRLGFQINNPPTIYPLLSLFSIFDLTTASVLWMAINGVLTIGICLSIARFLNMEWLLSIVMGFAWLPIPICIGIGQISIWILASLWFWFLLHRNYPFYAGLILSICSFKPHLAILIGLVVLLRLQGKTRNLNLIGGITGVLSLLAISFFINSNSINGYYQKVIHSSAESKSSPIETVDRTNGSSGPQVIADRSEQPLIGQTKLTDYYAATMPAVMRYLIGWESNTWIQFTPLMIGVIVLSIMYYRTKSDKPVSFVEWSDVLLWTMLLVPYAWHYDQVILLPVVLWIAQYMFDEHRNKTNRIRSAILPCAIIVGMLLMILNDTLELWYALSIPVLAIAFLTHRNLENPMQNKNGSMID